MEYTIDPCLICENYMHGIKCENDSCEIKQAKYSAIKEFAKRLKDAFPEGNRDCKCPAIYFEDYCDIIDEWCNVMLDDIVEE